MRNRDKLAGLMFTLLLLGVDVAKAAPPLMTHHGHLSLAGQPVEGLVQVMFRLFDGASTPLPLWEEVLSVDCRSGYYSALLGMTEPLDAGGMLAVGELWLELMVGGTTLAPRLRVASVPYALVAQRAVSADDVSCEGCVSAPEVAFGYAGSASPGGPANELDCSACVQTGELDNGAVANAKLADAAVSVSKLATPVAQALVPAGAIMAFNLSACPAGWFAADGQNGTPDLRGQFVRGLNNFGSGARSDGYQDPATRGLASFQEYNFPTFAARSDYYGSSYTHSETWIPKDGGYNEPGLFGGYWSGPGNGLRWRWETGAGADVRPRNVALIYCQKQ